MFITPYIFIVYDAYDLFMQCVSVYNSSIMDCLKWYGSYVKNHIYESFLTGCTKYLDIVAIKVLICVIDMPLNNVLTVGQFIPGGRYIIDSLIQGWKMRTYIIGDWMWMCDLEKKPHMN